MSSDRRSVPRSGAEERVGGPARGYSWPPFEPGNTAAVRSGFYVSPLMRDEDAAEVEEIAGQVRELLAVPVQERPEFDLGVEQIALKVWRQRRAYRDLSERGILRKGGKPAALLADLSKLETAIAKDLDAYGLRPRAAVALGLDLVRTAGAKLTVTRLAALAEAEAKAEADAA